MTLSGLWYLNATRYLEAVGDALKQDTPADLLDAYKDFIDICKEKNEEEMIAALWHLRLTWADYQDKLDGTNKNRIFEQTCMDYEKGVDYVQEDSENTEDLLEAMRDYGRWSAGEIDDYGNEIKDE